MSKQSNLKRWYTPTKYSILEVLMKRDGMDRLEAEELIRDARERVFMHGENPFDLVYEEFGLEPDYVDDLIL